MKVGDSWLCPRCGKNSFLKKESVMDGWKKTGEVLKCASCGMTVETVGAADATAHGPAGTPSAEKRASDALSALLGGDAGIKTVNPLADAERRFCRDCKFRVASAFRMYCTKRERDVNPMDDCPDYQNRES